MRRIYGCLLECQLDMMHNLHVQSEGNLSPLQNESFQEHQTRDENGEYRPCMVALHAVAVGQIHTSHRVR